MSSLTDIQYPCYVHKKVEGVRFRYIHDSLFLQKGLDSDTKKQIVEELDALYKLRNYMLDGIYSLAEQKAYLFDGMTLDEFNTQTCNLIYQDRLGLVRHCINCLGNYKKIIDMPLDICNDMGDVKNTQDKLKEQGYSSMVKNMHDKYNFEEKS